MSPDDSPVVHENPTEDQKAGDTAHTDWLTSVMAGKGVGAPPQGRTHLGFAWGLVLGILVTFLALIIFFAVLWALKLGAS